MRRRWVLSYSRSPLWIIALILIPRSGSSGSLSKKLDTIARISALDDGWNKGWVDCRALDSLEKTDLMIAAKHQSAGIRECALQHINSKYLYDLTAGELAEVSRSLAQHTEPRECMAAGEILGSRAAEAKDLLWTTLRGADDEAALCAATGVLKSVGSVDIELKKAAKQRIQTCLLHCDALHVNGAVNYLLNHHQEPDDAAWVQSNLADVSLSTTARVKLAFVWENLPHDSDFTFAERLLGDPLPWVRSAAVIVVAKSKSDRAIQDVITATRDSDEGPRRAAYSMLRQVKDPQALPAFLRGLANPDNEIQNNSIWGVADLGAKSALPKLIDIIREKGGNRKGHYLNDMAAAEAVAKITGEKFDFRSSGYCGTPFASAGALIERGKDIGGERGKALIDQGRKMSASYSASIASATAVVDAHNAAEMTRLLAWWDTQGSKQFGGP